MNKIKIITFLILSVISFESFTDEKTLSDKIKATFDQISKIWNSKEKTISGLDANVNNDMNNVMNAIQNSLRAGTAKIPLTEVLNLINSLKNQKNFEPVSSKLSNETLKILKNIFDETDSFYKKLIETQKIVANAKAESELIGNTTSFSQLATGVLVSIKSYIENYNNSSSLLPLKLSDEEKEQESHAAAELNSTKLYDVVIK